MSTWVPVYFGAIENSEIGSDFASRFEKDPIQVLANLLPHEDQELLCRHGWYTTFSRNYGLRSAWSPGP
jgi:hypothetical protein